MLLYGYGFDPDIYFIGRDENRVLTVIVLIEADAMMHKWSVYI